jgi:hypothetical protein
MNYDVLIEKIKTILSEDQAFSKFPFKTQIMANKIANAIIEDQNNNNTNKNNNKQIILE